MDSHKALPIQHLQATPIAGISRAQVTARIAAALVGVTRHAATLFYQKVRKIIATKLESVMLFSGEVEVEESYFGDKCKGNAVATQQTRSRFSAFSTVATKSIPR